MNTTTTVSPVLTHIVLPGKAWEAVTWPEGVESYREALGGGYIATVIVRQDRAEAIGRALVKAMDHSPSVVRHRIASEVAGLIAVLARNIGGQS